MKLKILTPTNTEKGSVDLPVVFDEPVRADLIKRAVETIQANTRQPYGADPRAGKKCSAELSRRRRKYRGSYGHGISRVPRKILSRNGTRMYWVGAFIPGTVGGRRAHAPKSSKIWAKKLNIKERRKAIRSAMAATLVKDLVAERGHIAPENYPFALSADFESISKTKDINKALTTLGLKDELSRAEGKTFRGGRARLRGRKYRSKKGPLLVVSKDCKLLKAAKNIPGVDVIEIGYLNTELLAPGSVPGRLTLFTESALAELGKTSLFSNGKTKAQKKPAKEFPKKAKDKEARAKKRAKKAKHTKSKKEAAPRQESQSTE